MSREESDHADEHQEAIARYERRNIDKEQKLDEMVRDIQAARPTIILKKHPSNIKGGEQDGLLETNSALPGAGLQEANGSQEREVRGTPEEEVQARRLLSDD